MIVYRLRCENGHEFEGWFKSSKACDSQSKSGSLECPTCATTNVTKAIMAPNIAVKGENKVSPAKKGTTVKDVDSATFGKMAVAVRDYVEKNFDYVGEKFPEEARRIHYGEADERGIYGEASSDETKALIDEGVDIAPLPGLSKRKTN